MNQDGVAVAASTNDNTLPGGVNEVVITVNPSMIANASKQYVTAILLHELLHGIITVRAGQQLNTSKLQHHYMFESGGVASIYQSLAELFPTLNQDHPDHLVSLSLLGLDDAIEIDDPLNPGHKITDPAKNQTAVSKYDQNLNQAF